MYAELTSENHAVKDLIEKKSEASGEARRSAISGGRIYFKQCRSRATVWRLDVGAYERCDIWTLWL